MTELVGKGRLKSATIEAVVIRADGTREVLGVISRYERNPFKRLFYQVRGALGGSK